MTESVSAAGFAYGDAQSCQPPNAEEILQPVQTANTFARNVAQASWPPTIPMFGLDYPRLSRQTAVQRERKNTEPTRLRESPKVSPHDYPRRARFATEPAPRSARRLSWATWSSEDCEQPTIAMEASSGLLMYRSNLTHLTRSSDDGPGRELQKADAVQTWVKPKLTAGILTVVALLNLVDCINMNILTPYAVDMVGSLLGQDPSSPSVLRNVGYLIGVYNISEMIFSPLWGRLSDRHGRRPVILASLGGAALVPIVFGMSQSFWMALAVRAFNGVLCGSLGITKTYIAELVEKGKEAKAFSIITTCYSVGMMIGPALGGLLQSPAKWSPTVACFLDHGVLRVFRSNPYLLPNAVFSAFACMVWLLVFFFLPESLPYEARQARRAAVEAAKELKLEEDRAAMAEEGTAEADRAGMKATCYFSNYFSNASLTSQLPFLTYPSSVLRAMAAYALCVGYVISTVQNIVLLYQIPLSQHGFGLSPGTLGMLQNCAAMGLLVTQLIFYPRLVQLKGYRWCIWLGLSGVLIVTVPMPLYGLLYDPKKFAEVRMVPLVLMMVTQQAAFGFCTPTTMVWINRFSEGMDRGEVNGWANSLAALCRALAPMLVGNLQAFGATWTWEGGRYLALYAISLLAVAVGVLLLPVLPGLSTTSKEAPEANNFADDEDENTADAISGEDVKASQSQPEFMPPALGERR
eukprot:TRINITY_DN1722_c0_g1_i3.p1 TRINITY_DN1722_c0_g1~~TRINITY_DN1722_c0_g1_i3.p1  ORF type:complete len:692 (+),score=129.77 TRINITY_DN1722_c0_g1_i3:172-2247(+)